MPSLDSLTMIFPVCNPSLFPGPPLASRPRRIVRKRLQRMEIALETAFPGETRDTSMSVTLEAVLQQQRGVSFNEARSLALRGRSNLGMPKRSQWTTELYKECCKLYHEKSTSKSLNDSASCKTSVHKAEIVVDFSQNWKMRGAFTAPEPTVKVGSQFRRTTTTKAPIVAGDTNRDLKQRQSRRRARNASTVYKKSPLSQRPTSSPSTDDLGAFFREAIVQRYTAEALAIGKSSSEQEAKPPKDICFQSNCIVSEPDQVQDIPVEEKSYETTSMLSEDQDSHSDSDTIPSYSDSCSPSTGEASSINGSDEILSLRSDESREEVIESCSLLSSSHENVDVKVSGTESSSQSSSSTGSPAHVEEPESSECWNVYPEEEEDDADDFVWEEYYEEEVLDYEPTCLSVIYEEDDEYLEDEDYMEVHGMPRISKNLVVYYPADYNAEKCGPSELEETESTESSTMYEEEMLGPLTQ